MDLAMLRFYDSVAYYRSASLQRMFSILMIIIMTMVMVPSMVGCTISKAQIQSYGDTIDSALASILTMEGNTELARQIQQARSTFDNSVFGWDGASKSGMIISSLNALELILHLIPITAPYAPLIDVIIAAAESIIASLPVNASTAMVRASHKVQVTHTPYFKNPNQFVAAWNNVLAVHSELKVPKLVVVK